MKQTTYYTVIIGKRSCMVSYATGPAYETRLFSGSFADPGEASQQFKKTMQCQLECLTEKAFARKVGELAYRYNRDLLKLQTWNQGSHTHAQERSPRMALTTSQFINGLPPNGLELAEEYLEQDLDLLREEGLPVSDTVAGVLTVKSLQHAQEEEDDEIKA